jgi:phosphatidylserine/phosphatidylglycerophosphate/cardiolipin synthase-like enzyme
MRGDDALLSAGVPLLGVRRPGRGAMHMKLALFDGRVASTGSANWQTGARYANHENYIETTESDIVGCYAKRFTALAGGVLTPSDCEKAHFGPDEPLHTFVGHIIDEAHTSLEIAMFTAKAFDYRENGLETSLFTKLVEAVDRGVDVTLITDHGIAEASEYYGRISEDDPTDEWLEERGVHVIRADNRFARYASMHHKFVIVDHELVLSGAYNWYYDSSFINDEDIIVLDEPGIVSQFRAEFLDLVWRYGLGEEQVEWPITSLELSVHHNQTDWGDELYLLGSLPELGTWNLDHAVQLNARDWPLWKTTLHLPAGVRFEWKLLIKHADGRWQWETSDNRQTQTPVSGGVVDTTFRRAQ